MKKITKLYILIGIIMITFIIFLVIIYKPKNYQLKYTVNKISVKEAYNKNYKKYIFQISDNNYVLAINQKYSKKRNIIENIEEYSLEDEACYKIYLESEYLVCGKQKEQKAYHTMSKKFQEKYNLQESKERILSRFKDVSIYNYDNTYILWNYKGILKIVDNDNTEMTLLTTDNYDNFNGFQTDRYVVFPNYNEEYYFQTFYIYDVQKDKINDITFEYELSYQTYFLGYCRNKAYILDPKTKIEYEINLLKNSIKIIGTAEKEGTIFDRGKFKKISINKLINDNVKFNYIFHTEYNIDNAKLYKHVENQKILISNKKVDFIVKYDEENVYYLVDNTLYKYNDKIGEVKALVNNEWSFNQKNQIFIF